VLILDDLGSQKWSEWVQDMLAHVINDRYKHGHCTIFTTNYLDPQPSSLSIEELDQVRIKQLKDLGVINDAGEIDQFKMKQLKELGVAFRSREQHDTLEDRIGDRLRSRLTQMCKTVKMYGEDFRRQIGIQKIR
jgi:DNA replication protein DnaC